MNTFEVANQGADAFVDAIQKALGSRKLGDFVAFEKRGDAIVLLFTRLGTSEIHFTVTPVGSGFRAKSSSEKIAFAHRAFRGEFESRVVRLLEKAGAKVS